MSVDRRHFLFAGSTLGAGGLMSTAYAAATSSARSVTDFGVLPNSKADQTTLLQKAINELSGAGQAIVLPAGRYNAVTLTVPQQCSIIGVPGQTALQVSQIHTVTVNDETSLFSMFGVNLFPHDVNDKASAHVILSSLSVRIANCNFISGGANALSFNGCSGSLHALEISGYADSGILAQRSELTIQSCRFAGCGTGIKVLASTSAIVAQNAFRQCGTGIAADGIALVSGNIVKGAKDFGLKLGAASGKGRIVAQGNLLDDCGVGIGVTASGDEIFASLNLIHGAKDGAIRAFDGDKLVGRDLARESAEVYLNLTVAGNVAR